jgi:hypothetical protein
MEGVRPMRLRDRFRAGFEAFFSGSEQPAVVDGIAIPVPDFDLPLQPTDLVARREAASTAVALRKTDLKRAEESISLGMGLSLDPDDQFYRRLTGDAKSKRRDLNPLQQDRMLEIVWYLWEQNPFARRLITLMTDLILGNGSTWSKATDERIQEIDATWNHRVNQLAVRLSGIPQCPVLNGELVLPVATNPITGPAGFRVHRPLPGEGRAGSRTGQRADPRHRDPEVRARGSRKRP